MTPRLLIVAGIVLVVALILATSSWVNHESCLRSDATRKAALVAYQGAADRAAQRAQVDHGATERIDLEAYHAAVQSALLVMPLNCAALIPATSVITR